MIEIMRASAGSGKTYNLARKYLSLLIGNPDKYAYRHVLAVTFTNKATEEMKSRILKELHLLTVCPESSPYFSGFVPSCIGSASELKERAGTVLFNILHDYGAFSVSTIDRFFQQTLKAFSREIGQYASYQVELDKKSLVQESVDRLLDSLTEKDGNLLSWLTTNVLERIETGERYSPDANLYEMAERLNSDEFREITERNGINISETFSKENLRKIRRICKETITGFEREAMEKAKCILELFREAGVAPEETNRGFLKALYAYEDGDFDGMLAAPSPAFMKSAADPDRWFSKTKSVKLLPMVYPAASGPMDEFLGLFGIRYKEYMTAGMIEGQLYGLGVAGELSSVFNGIMKEKNVLCIDDSNVLLKKIIDGSDAPFIYEKLGVRYENFLLDEFQDTSEIQWENFSPLLHNSDAQNFSNLIVGDVKQSIYRWRGSEWRLLHEKLKDEFPGCREDTLGGNYRSLGNIVGFNNSFFKFASAVMDMNYPYSDENVISSIYSGVEQKVSSDDTSEGSVGLVFCDKEKETDHILSLVRRVVENGGRLSDIAILVRSNKTGGNISSFLLQNGIDVITDDSLSIKNSGTVRKIVSVMSRVDNPEDSINGYHAGEMDLDFPESYNSLVDLAEMILRRLSEKDGETVLMEVPYIQSFMDVLLDYSKVNGNGLRGFLKYWEEHDPSISSPSEGDAVRIMTIHKSKGLDFPYVILPYVENIGLYKAGPVWCRPELSGTSLQGIGPAVFDVVLSKNADNTFFSDDYRAEMLMQYIDNLNILYVAMTRASKGLGIISAKPSQSVLAADPEQGCPVFSDMSQILYWYVRHSAGIPAVVEDGDSIVFETGQMYDFRMGQGKQKETGADTVKSGYPSFPLNPEDGRERGRLRCSPDSGTFFTDLCQAPSRRQRGIVLHDILSGVRHAGDLRVSVDSQLRDGLLSMSEAEEAFALLDERLSSGALKELFTGDFDRIYNEREILTAEGEVLRPDRVVVKGESVQIVDYKFGTARNVYRNQIRKYANIYEQMGYKVDGAYLWFVDTDEIEPVI